MRDSAGAAAAEELAWPRAVLRSPLPLLAAADGSSRFISCADVNTRPLNVSLV